MVDEKKDEFSDEKKGLPSSLAEGGKLAAQDVMDGVEKGAQDMKAAVKNGRRDKSDDNGFDNSAPGGRSVGLHR